MSWKMCQFKKNCLEILKKFMQSISLLKLLYPKLRFNRFFYLQYNQRNWFHFYAFFKSLTLYQKMSTMGISWFYVNDGATGKIHC